MSNRVNPNPVSHVATGINAVSMTQTLHRDQQSSPFAVIRHPQHEAPLKPRPKVSVASMTVKEQSTKSLFNYQKNPASVFSPNYTPTAVGKQEIAQNHQIPSKIVEKAGEKISIQVTQNREVSCETGRGEGVSGRGDISTITWGDEGDTGGEGGGEGGEGLGEGGTARKEARAVRFQNSSGEDTAPVAKKVNMTLSLSYPTHQTYTMSLLNNGSMEVHRCTTCIPLPMLSLTHNTVFIVRVLCPGKTGRSWSGKTSQTATQRIQFTRQIQPEGQ